MNENIRKILKLVANKKISSEDGEKLIREILRHEREKTKIGDMVGNTEIGMKNVNISILSGDLTVVGRDEGGVDATASGSMTGTQEGDTFFIKAQKADDVTIKANDKLNIKAKILSGDVELERIKGNLNIVAVSGDIRMSDIKGGFVKSVSGDMDINGINGNIKIKSVSGDIRAHIIDSSSVTIDAVTSDIDIEIPRNIGMDMNIYSKNGNIDVDFDSDTTSKAEKGVFTAKRGDEHLKINITVREGDVRVKEY